MYPNRLWITLPLGDNRILPNLDAPCQCDSEKLLHFCLLVWWEGYPGESWDLLIKATIGGKWCWFRSFFFGEYFILLTLIPWEIQNPENITGRAETLGLEVNPWVMKPLKLGRVQVESTISRLGGNFLSDEIPLALWFGALLCPLLPGLLCCCHPAEGAAPVPECAAPATHPCAQN